MLLVEDLWVDDHLAECWLVLEGGCGQHSSCWSVLLEVTYLLCWCGGVACLEGWRDGVGL